MLIITTHATIVNNKIYEAPSNVLMENLIKQKKDFIFIRHFMNWEKSSEVHIYNWWLKQSESKLFILSRFSVLRYITEIVSTFFYILLSSYKNITYIWVDPLNSFTWFLLKFFRRIKKNIFYTPDYSPERFWNKLLNKVYHFIDRTCVFWSDEVWNVSSRIYEIRKNMWLADKKNIFLPNIPWNIPKDFFKNSKNKFDLVTLWIVSEQLDFIWVFDAIKILREKYPEILFKIIWNWPKETEYKEYVKNIWIEDSVNFLWYLEHKKALEEISKSWVWLALYNWKWGFNYFWDSMKCREYFAFWLVVLTTDTHSTVMDINENNVWIVSEMKFESYIKALENIFENYEDYSKRSLQLWEKYTNFYLEKIKDLW